MQKAPRLQMEVIFMSSPQLSTDSHSMLPFPFQVITVFLPPQFCLVSMSHFLFLRPQDITISHLTGESDVGLLHKKVVCPQCTSFSQVGPSVRLKYFLQRTTENNSTDLSGSRDHWELVYLLVHPISMEGRRV